jgi:DNA-binding MarR family transcriptional regulator
MAALLLSTIVASTGYYNRIRQAKIEYEKARSVVEDIVLSFNRELKIEAEKVEQIAFKIESSIGKSETSLRKINSIEKNISHVESQLYYLEEQKKTFEEHKDIIENHKKIREAQINQFNDLTQNNNSLTSALAGLDVKIKNIETTYESLINRINGFEEQIQKSSLTLSEFKIDQTIPVIPIKRDKALASLTNTEIAVLEMLSVEGAKTAPEIKERVNLSREHTARLMKKLYEDGYLEREMGKIPFKYNVKKEMEKILKKEEPNTS